MRMVAMRSIGYIQRRRTGTKVHASAMSTLRGPGHPKISEYMLFHFIRVYMCMYHIAPRFTLLVRGLEGAILQ